MNQIMKPAIMSIILLIVAIVFSSSTRATLEGPGSGLVGWWKFDDGAGTTVVDSSVTVNNGVFRGSPSWVVDPGMGTVLKFHGDVDFIRISENNATRVGVKTIAVWLKTADFIKNDGAIYGAHRDAMGFTCADSYVAFVKSDVAGGWRYIDDGYQNYGTTGANGGCDKDHKVTNFGVVKLGQWEHWVFTHDITPPNGPSAPISLCAYKNGVLAGPCYTASNGMETNQCGLTGIGTQQDIMQERYFRYYSGMMKDFRIYNRILTSEEITELAAASRPVSTDTTPPSTPTNLISTAGNPFHIDLSWTASTDNVGVVGYIIYRATGPSCSSYISIATVEGGATTYRDRGQDATSGLFPLHMTSGSSYCYKVAAYDAAYTYGSDANLSPMSAATSPITVTQESGTYNLTVTKTGSPLTYTMLSYPSGISCGSGCTTQTYAFPRGAIIQLNPYPSGFGESRLDPVPFIGWSGGTQGCTGNGGCLLYMDGDKSITATYGTLPSSYTLTVTKTGAGTGTVTSSPAGITCGSTCSVSYSSGTSVTLTASPSGGYNFAGWSGACSGTGLCVVTISSNTSVTATFTSAPTPINGVCGLTLNSCTSGTFSDVADTPTNYLWSCVGLNGGTTASCSMPITTPTTGEPVGWWKLDEGSGTTTADATGRGHTGTLVNSPSWVTGKFNGALSFDGVSTYVTIPASSDFDSPNEFSVSAWVYPTDPTTRQTAVARTMNNDWHLWQLEQINQAGGTARFDIEYVTRLNVSDVALRARGSTYSMNTWHHVVAVKTTGGIVKIYVDGVKGTDSAVNPNPDPDLSGLDISIGSRRAIVADTIWKGYIDDVRFYNRSLSEAEILTLYNGTVPQTYTLTVSHTGTGGGIITSSPSAISCATGTCSASFSSGTPVTLSASAAFGSSFSGWIGGGCSGTGTCAVTMSSDISITANFTLVGDTTPPTVTAFSIPSSSSSLIVPITTFTAYDNVGVTGYLLTETSSTPPPTAPGWTVTAPSLYAFSSNGTKTLYAWAKDAASLVSSRLSDSVTITYTPPSGTFHYIRAGATGAGNGNDWVNAWTSTPSGLIRGDTYYIAGGTYPSMTISSCIGSSGNCAIKKATSSDHGTDTGWSISYGTDPAIIRNAGGTLYIAASNIEIDGQYRGYDWISGYGMQFYNNASSGWSYGVNIAEGVSNIALRYIDMGLNPAYVDGGMDVIKATGITYGISNLTFQYVYAHDSSEDIFSFRNVNNIFIDHSYLARNRVNGVTHGQGISNDRCNNVVISNNYFRDIQSSGQICTGMSLTGPSDNWSIFNNVFFRSSDVVLTPWNIFPGYINNSGITSGWMGTNGFIRVWDGYGTRTGWLIYDNTFVGIGGVGAAVSVDFPSGSTGNYVYNNLFYGSNNSAYNMINVAHDYNWFYGATAYPTEANRIIGTENPFINSGAYDFRLKANASAIDRGLALGQVFSNDMDGVSRPQGSGWDMGAYEYSSGIPCIHKSDINCNGCVDMSELTAFINRWKINNLDVTLKELMEAIGLWNRGGC